MGQSQIFPRGQLTGGQWGSFCHLRVRRPPHHPEGASASFLQTGAGTTPDAPALGAGALVHILGELAGCWEQSSRENKQETDLSTAACRRQAGGTCLMTRLQFNKWRERSSSLYCNYLGSRVDGEQRNRVHAAGRGDVEDGPPLPAYRKKRGTWAKGKMATNKPEINHRTSTENAAMFVSPPRQNSSSWSEEWSWNQRDQGRGEKST